MRKRARRWFCGLDLSRRGGRRRSSEFGGGFLRCEFVGLFAGGSRCAGGSGEVERAADWGWSAVGVDGSVGSFETEASGAVTERVWSA